ncbi:MAG: YkgJ family cysteine cluster protein [Acidimicrobiia bacterium]|nr:YkgJ family cysteine cluster protein [Acidimicrobiia bacterium]
MTEDGPIPAGPFADWLAGIEQALDGGTGSDVPCGPCTACCSSSQFVHIAPDETDALAHIPAALLFPAPMLPRGHVVLGYDEHGCCPMLADGACSIYEHRPRTCRTYDCRIFTAAGVEVDGAEQPGVARRVRRWRFDHPGPADQAAHDAVRSAARFALEHADELPPDARPANPVQRAVLAIRIHRAFSEPGGGPDPEAVRVELVRRWR